MSRLSRLAGVVRSLAEIEMLDAASEDHQICVAFRVEPTDVGWWSLEIVVQAAVEAGATVVATAEPALADSLAFELRCQNSEVAKLVETLEFYTAQCEPD